jgi:antitoxin component YwqK of YwqJK toxin-antitoxin module
MKTKDITPYNDQDKRHGYWEVYYENGQLMYKGNYVNGIKHGYWESYHYNGKLINKTYYI